MLSLGFTGKNTISLCVYLQEKTTPELYYMSLILTVAFISSTGEVHFLYMHTVGAIHTQNCHFKEITPGFVCSVFFMVRGGLWLTNMRPVMDLSRNNEQQNSPAVPR